MDTKISTAKSNRLFWLGRYVERSYNCVSMLMKFYDALIDSDTPDYTAYCINMGIPCDYTDGADFFNRFLGDENTVCSAVSYMNCAMGNGMVLRETISSQTLAYLQLAQGALNQAVNSDAPCLELQLVLDNIIAFRGSFDDTADSENARNITKTGGMVERISTMIRLGAEEDKLRNECMKLLNRMYKTDLEHSIEAAAGISAYAFDGTGTKRELLGNVECLFKV